MKTGKVDRVEFTQNSLGNQWTTIDGKRYMTWWDIRTLPIKAGATVEYTPFDGSLNISNSVLEYKGVKIHRVLESQL